MYDKTVFVSLALPGHHDGTFHQYLPWRDGPAKDHLMYAVGLDEDGDDIFIVETMLGDGKMWRYDLEQTCPFMHKFDIEDVDADQPTLQYFDINQNDYRHRLWLEVNEYIAFLDVKIAELIEECHPYVVFLENLRDNVKLYAEAMQGFDAKVHEQLNIFYLPAMRIPKTRYDQFKVEGGAVKGQRLGQVFFDYMQADKCTQDKAWWDRLYQANDTLSLAMIKAVIDWDN